MVPTTTCGFVPAEVFGGAGVLRFRTAPTERSIAMTVRLRRLVPAALAIASALVIGAGARELLLHSMYDHLDQLDALATVAALVRDR
jgi:hypothetical protein